MSFGDLRLGKRDWDVIHAFLGHYPAASKKLETDGQHLDGLWMGGRNIAVWHGGRIVFEEPGGRAAQTVQRAITKTAPRNWLDPALAVRGLGDSWTKRFFAEQLDPEQERMLNEVLLVAANEGRFYNRPKQAVDHAIKEYIRYHTLSMREDAQTIRDHAIQELQRQRRKQR